MRVTGVKRNQNISVVADLNTIKTKHRIHNIFVVDASGSMAGGKYTNAIGGVNNLLKNINEDTETINTVMIVEFEGSSVVRRVDLTGDIPSTYKGMGTNGMTPLNQAVGETLDYIIKKRKKDYDVIDKVLVNVFTDGGENSSQGKWADAYVLGEYIKSLESEGVTVTFIGTQTEVNYAVNTLNLRASNTLVHNNTAADIKRSFDTTVMARQAYSKSVAMGEDVTASFYTKTVESNDDK